MSRPRLVALAACTAVLAFAGSSAADAARTAPVLHPGLNSVAVCDGTLVAVFSLEQLDGHHWVSVPDDSHEGLQVHLGGHWKAVPAVSGGENHLRLAAWPANSAVDLVRIVRTDGTRITSSPLPVSPTCPTTI